MIKRRNETLPMGQRLPSQKKCTSNKSQVSTGYHEPERKRDITAKKKIVNIRFANGSCKITNGSWIVTSNPMGFMIQKLNRKGNTVKSI